MLGQILPLFNHQNAVQAWKKPYTRFNEHGSKFKEQSTQLETQNEGVKVRTIDSQAQNI